MNPSPIQFLKEEAGRQIYVKRDDLLPLALGGNKLRIGLAFLDHMTRQGKDCLLGYGNARSNLSRVLAILAGSRNLPCHIICPDDEDGSRRETFNSCIVRESGAVLHPCSKTKVRETVEKVLDELRTAGFDPYYIYGGSDGRGHEAVPLQAYYDAAREIQAGEEAEHIHFDHIFLACGTGMTQAGLLLGAEDLKKHWQIHGISIARSEERCRQELIRQMEAFRQERGRGPVPEPLVSDAYLGGGYGLYDRTIEELIRKMLSCYGLPLDPCYTGKAFYGMLREIPLTTEPGEKILFLHTGGTPLFYDYLTDLSIR